MFPEKGISLKRIQSFVYLEHNTVLNWFLLQPELKSQKLSQIKNSVGLDTVHTKGKGKKTKNLNVVDVLTVQEQIL
jgi:hypothetical protein